MRKNDAFVAKIVNTRLTKGFMAIFAPAESLPSPATLNLPKYYHKFVNILYVVLAKQQKRNCHLFFNHPGFVGRVVAV